MRSTSTQQGPQDPRNVEKVHGGNCHTNDLMHRHTKKNVKALLVIDLDRKKLVQCRLSYAQLDQLTFDLLMDAC